MNTAAGDPPPYGFTFPPTFGATVAKGWECPRCSRVYSPDTGQCSWCNMFSVPLELHAPPPAPETPESQLIDKVAWTVRAVAAEWMREHPEAPPPRIVAEWLETFGAEPCMVRISVDPTSPTA